MRGTDADRAALVRHLTLAGWLLLGGSLGLVAFQLDRVRRVGSGSRFADAWDQRVEVLSFLMLPPNLVVLAPAVLAAAVASILGGRDRGPWLVALLRLAAAIAVIMAAIGIVSIVSIFVRDDGGPIESADVFIRVGGVLLASGYVTVSWAADRWGTTPDEDERARARRPSPPQATH